MLEPSVHFLLRFATFASVRMSGVHARRPPPARVYTLVLATFFFDAWLPWGDSCTLWRWPALLSLLVFASLLSILSSAPQKCLFSTVGRCRNETRRCRNGSRRRRHGTGRCRSGSGRCSRRPGSAADAAAGAVDDGALDDTAGPIRSLHARINRCSVLLTVCARDVVLWCTSSNLRVR